MHEGSLAGIIQKQHGLIPHTENKTNNIQCRRVVEKEYFLQNRGRYHETYRSDR